MSLHISSCKCFQQHTNDRNVSAKLNSDSAKFQQAENVFQSH